jgi:ribosomal protein S18 acetylase RimI-like enzyme
VAPTEIDAVMVATHLPQTAADVTITRLAPDDWQDFKVLRLDALSTDPQAFEASYEALRAKPDAYWAEQLQRAAEGNGYWLLFAKRDQRLVGMAGALFCEERKTANITSVFVSKTARGQGVGTELMGALLEELRQDRSVERLRLYVNVAQTAALHLYDHFGFLVVEPERARYGDGQDHDGYVMERPSA